MSTIASLRNTAPKPSTLVPRSRLTVVPPRSTSRPPPPSIGQLPMSGPKPGSAPRPTTGPELAHDIEDRQRERFGGVKVGSAFFGWLTAMGTAAILTAVLAAAGAALGLGVAGTPDDAADEALQNAETVGWIGAISLLVVLFVAYFSGGYVAGRMARFNGLKQGLAVWVWALVIAIVVALISVVLGSQYDVLVDLNAFPRIPVSEGELTVAGIVTAVIVALASLGGALLGGWTGTRYHRRVDRAGIEEPVYSHD